MKLFKYTLLAIAASCGLASAAATAYTTPVGYYDADVKAGGNLFISGLVNSTAFAGNITAAGSTTLTVAAAALTANAFNELAAIVGPPAIPARATHYVEITQAGANQGVVVDIVSNTDTVITLASDISALSLAGTETIAIRPHVTLKSLFANEEANIAVFSDTATFYEANGSLIGYFFDGTNWTSDGSNPDGNSRPISPGTGFVFNVLADKPLTITGEVKASPTVVQLNGNSVVNIVGPVNPLVGETDTVQSLGFAALVPFQDTITLYQPGTVALLASLFSDGTNVTEDGSTPSTATLGATTGGVVSAVSDTSIRVNSGFTVAP